MKTIFTCVPITIVLLLGFLIIACDSEDDPIDNWIVDEQGYFYTNDIAKAQEELPFTIIIPSYLPEGFGTIPNSISGRLTEAWPENELQVEIVYQYLVDDYVEKLVHITELNQTALQLGSGGGVIIELNGTTVIQWDDSIPVLRGESIDDIEGFSFHWNQNNLFVSVGVYGCSYDEAVRIAKSMIK